MQGRSPTKSTGIYRGFINETISVQVNNSFVNIGQLKPLKPYQIKALNEGLFL